MPINRYTDKETIHTNGILYGTKKKQTAIICNNLNESKKHYRRQTQKDYTLFDFIYMKF